MPILYYLMSFTVILLLFSYIWSYLIVLPLSLLFTLLNFPSKITYILKFGEAYFAASLTSLVTLGAINGADEIWMKILIAFIGCFFFYFYFGNSIYQKEKEAREQHDYFVLAHMNSDYFTMVIAIALFIIMLFIPQLAITPPVMGFLNLMDWLYNLRVVGPILRVVLSIVAFFMAISWLISGILFMGIMISTVVAKIRRKPETENLTSQLNVDENELINIDEDQNTIISKNDANKYINDANDPEIQANNIFNHVLKSCGNFLADEDIITKLEITDENEFYIFQELLGVYLFEAKYYIRETDKTQSEQIAYYLNHNLSKYALNQSYNEESIQKLLNFMNARYEQYTEELKKPDANTKNLGILLIYFIKGTYVEDEDLIFIVSAYISAFKILLKQAYNN